MATRGNKRRRRDTLEGNRRKGKVWENMVAGGLAMQGYKPKRTGCGSDFLAENLGPVRKDPVTGEAIKDMLVEAKASRKAKLSARQK